MSSRVRKRQGGRITVQLTFAGGRCDMCAQHVQWLSEVTTAGSASPTGKAITVVACSECAGELVGSAIRLAEDIASEMEPGPTVWVTEERPAFDGFGEAIDAVRSIPTAE